MKQLLTILTASALLLGMTACAGKTRDVSAPAEPAGATLTVALSHSYKGEPITDDVDFRYGNFSVRGDKIILTGYPEGYTAIGLYDTASGTLTKTQITPDEDKGYTTFDGYDWRDGRLTVLCTHWAKEGEPFDGYRWEYMVFDDKLNLLETRPVAEGWDNQQSILDWRVLSDGTQAFTTTGGFYLYDEQGGIRKISSVSPARIVLSPDETVWIIPDGGKPKRFDRETNTLEALQMDDLPTSHHNNGGYFDGFGEYPLLCTDTDALYGLKPDTGKQELLVNFADSDLVDAYDFAPLPDGRFACVTYDCLSFQSENLLLTPRTQEEMDSIRTVTLAALRFDQETQSRIARFNRQADGYRLVLKSYYDSSDVNTDYEVGVRAYRDDLLSGNVPDIMLLGQDYQMLSNKGLFEDMRPWMERDPDFREEDYMMNILEAFSYKGHLERIPWKFFACTNLAKTEFVGDRTNLTPSELLALDLPEGMCYFYSGLGKSEACRNLLLSAMGQYVDFENAACSFDSAEFVSLLELANTIPSGKLPEGAYCYQENTVLLDDVSFASLSNYHMYHEVVFGNADITLCGIGCGGGYALLSDSIAVSAQSKEKEAAWEFIKFNLREEQQYFGRDVPQNGFPINRNALAKMLADDTIPHDESHRSTFSMDGVEVEYGAATQEELAFLQNWLGTLETGLLDDTSITAIVQEEAGKYFAGDCTAESAAKAIQGRVEIYLAEQS